MTGLLIEPLVSFDLISREELNDRLVAWGHRHGPVLRPEYRKPIDFGLRHRGELVAVVAADTLIRETCGFTRRDAFELSRICAARPDLCRVALRLWRELALPEIVKAWATPWTISYQDAARHRGDLYRFDGWVKLGFTRSGSDARAQDATARVKQRVIWGWTQDRAALLARGAETSLAPRWAA